MATLTNAATITVVSTGEQFHTLNDWGLAIGNNDYIGTPEYEENSVDIPGRTGYLDMTEAVTGRLIYKSRQISIKFGGLRDRDEWDSEISRIRNKIHGQLIKITFDNDLSHYWIGRAQIKDFDRTRRLGTFILELPKAEPYKYDMFSSAEEWEWDPFDFEYGIIRYIGSVAVDGEITVSVPAGDMETVPIFTANNIKSGLTVEADGKNYNLVNGRNRFPSLTVCGDSDKDLVFKGHGTVEVDYRGGSL